MIDYDNQKHLKILAASLITIIFPIAAYVLYMAWNAVIDGFIYVSTSNFSGNIYFEKNPLKYLFYLVLFGGGGILYIYFALYILWNFKYLGRWKDRNNKDIFK